MSPYSLPALLAFAVNVSLVIILLLDDPRSHAHRLFALLLFCFALWDIADIIVVSSATPETAAIGGGIIVAALLFASAFFVLLSFSFPRPIESRFNRLPVRPLFLLLPLAYSILAGLGVFQPLELHRFASQGVYCYVVNTSGTILDAAMYGMVFLYLAWGVRNFAIQRGASPTWKERRQIATIIAGTLGFALLVAALDVLRGVEEVHFYASRALLILISFTFAYVVLGNRLLILHRLGREGLAYSVVTGLVFAFYLVVIKSIAAVTGQQLGVNSLVIEALLILTLAFLFRPLVARVQSLIEHLFRQSAFRRREEFIRFTRDESRVTGVGDLAGAVVAFAGATLSAACADMMTGSGSGGRFRSVLVPGRILSIGDEFRRRWAQNSNAYDVAEFTGNFLEDGREALKAFEGGFVFPLVSKNVVAGLLLIGPKRRGRYSADEEEFLAVFAGEVAGALERIVLTERMHAEELHVAQVEKLAALGRITAGIAHEFRNPLNIIAASAQTILRHPGDDALHQETGRYILEEAGRLNRTVDDFLEFARPHTPVWRQVAVEELLDRITAVLQPKADASGTRLRGEVRDFLPAITTSPQHLERALANLGLNAIEAMHDGGELVFSARREGENVAISVRDTGPGIPPDVQPKIFDPFLTTKPTGTGLGLPIVYMMVQSIKGQISFVTGPGGTTFTIELPINPARP